MGIFSAIGKQFLSVIDWTEEGDGILAYRYPMRDRELQNGSTLTVRESQLALFVNEGEIADSFGPGRYTLGTKNLPILTTLKNWDKAFNSPFKSDVYFFSTREQIDQKWGTAQPITVRDKEMGAIRIRAFGSYSYKIKNPAVFYKKISGSRDIYSVLDLEGQLRDAILASLASFFGGSGVAFLDMASNQTQFSETLKAALAPLFTGYGLELATFFVQSISLPEELQSYFDQAAQMRMVGDLGQFARFQAAESLQTAAANSGGSAGAGVGLGAGVALGQTLAGALGSGGASTGAGTGAGTGARTDIATAGTGSGGGGGEPDPMKLLERLHELKEKGVLSEAEYADKKAELLKKIK